MIPTITKVFAFAEHGGPLYALCPGEEPHFVYSGGSDRMLYLWNLQSKQPENFSAMLPSAIYSILLVKGKKLLLAGTSEGTIHLIDLEKKAETKVLKNHTAQVFCLYHSIKNNVIYAGGGEGLLSVTSLNSGSAIRILKISESKVRSMAMNANESELAIACGNGNILILDAESLNEKHRLQAHAISANALTYHPTSDILLSGGRDGYMKMWDAAGGYKCIRTIPAHTSNIYGIVSSPDKKFFASASRDKSIKVWDANSLELLVRIASDNRGGHVNSVNTVTWPEAQFLVSAGDDRSVIVWKVE